MSLLEQVVSPHAATLGAATHHSSRGDASTNPTVTDDKEAIKMQFHESLQQRKQECWKRGAHAACDVEVARTSVQDAEELEQQKKDLLKAVKQALGLKNPFAKNTCADIMRIIPKVVFLFIIVGCELDLYGFMMSFKSYWDLDVLPLQILLVTGPLGYLVAVVMFLSYGQSPESGPKSGCKEKVVPAPTRNEFKGVLPPTYDDVEEGSMSHRPVEHKTNDQKEELSMNFYHFMPIFRYYIVIKDQSASDVEGLFRVNSLSSFTLGITQICGMLFTLVNGQNFDLFVKLNVASQIINWFITALYFGTSIPARMKASFKVDTLLQNSVTTLRDEYESYLLTVDEATKGGGSEIAEQKIRAFHDSLNYEMSHFVMQPVDLSCLSMDEKYMLRQAVRKSMYLTYTKIN